jgi:integration host factor subunit beta
MIRSELINRLAALFPQFTPKDTELAVKAILEALSNTLAKGDRIEIRGFGSFGAQLPAATYWAQPKNR